MWNPIVLYDEDLVKDEQPPAAEQSVHRLLTRALREEDAPYAGDCLDSETVAAWMDGALAADVRAAAESHAAGCARCQAVLSAMVRTAPPVARRSWWPSSLTLKWLVPAAAAATAAALWIAVVPPATRPDATVPSSEIDRVASTAPSLTPPPPPAEPPAQTTPPARDRAASAPALARRQDKELDTRAIPKIQAPAMLEARRERSETAKSKEAFAADEAKQEKARPTPAAAAPLVDAAAAPRVPGSPALGGAQGFRTGLTLLVEIVSPDPAFRWRTGAGGVVYRTADDGLTWTPQKIGTTTADLTAGSSPSRDVCWLVGRGGTVLLSADGTTWQLRPFLEKVDLAAVSAMDAKTAMVITSDGRRFSTTDGGATWSATPRLQESPASPFYQ
jgi:hypothetical protein